MASQKSSAASTTLKSANNINTTTTGNPSAIAGPMNRMQQQPQQPALSYVLYLHREELRKRKISLMSISRTKFQLTQELITKTVQNIHRCSRDDLKVLSRETIYKKNLRREISLLKRHQRLKLAKYQKKQNDKFQRQRDNVGQQNQPEAWPQQKRLGH